MSELYNYIMNYLREQVGRSLTPTITPAEPRAPPGFLGLYGRYAYMHCETPTVMQVLNVNLVHDHLTGRRMLQFSLGVIEVWAFHPEKKDALPLAVFGMPLSYTAYMMRRLEHEGYRLLLVEHELARVTVPEENVYNIEHVSEDIGDTIIIDMYGMMRQFGGKLPPQSYLDRMLELERENMRLRVVLTNTAISMNKLLNDYVILRETVDRLSELIHMLYSQISSLMQRVEEVESRVRIMHEEVKRYRREAQYHKTIATIRELELAAYTTELPSKIEELRRDISTLHETVRAVMEDIDRLRRSLAGTITTVPAPGGASTPGASPPTGGAATTSTATASASAPGVVGLGFKRRLFKFRK